MKLLVGLGNPGSQYARNRHNVGFHTIDEIQSRHGFTPWRDRFHGQVSTGSIVGQKIILLKPSTYMNDSGRSVGDAVRFFKIPIEEIVVFYDELDLVPGKVRIKAGGGAGGHNGIRSIDAHIGKEYQRVRIGIGHPGHKGLVSRYVLSDFSKADAIWLEPLLEDLADALPTLLNDGSANFMNKLALSQKKVPNQKAETDQRTADSKTVNPDVEYGNEGDKLSTKPKIGPMAAALRALLPNTKKD